MSFCFARSLFPIIRDHVKACFPLASFVGYGRVAGVRCSVLYDVGEWMVVVIRGHTDATRIHNQPSVSESNRSWDVSMATQNERSIDGTCSFSHFV